MKNDDWKLRVCSIKIIRTFYIGSTGNKYSYEDYINHGFGGIYKGKKDLPLDEYPYTFEYKQEYNYTGK